MSDLETAPKPKAAGAAARLQAALPWTNRTLVLLAALLAFSTALKTRPVPYGDAPEYLLMAESLAAHGSPDLRDADLESVKLLFLRQGVEFPPHGTLVGYYESEDGRRYSYHFWLYSLVCLPARCLLRVFGIDELRALQVTNAAFMTLALLLVAAAAPLSEVRKLLLNGLLFFSPAAWFILWPHPEVFAFSWVAAALVLTACRRWTSAILCAVMAALEIPQLALLVAFVWLKAALRIKARLGGGGIALRIAGRRHDLVRHALPALLLALHPLFYYVHFGTFSVVAEKATSLQKVSLSRAMDLLFDLNLGLLPYVPVALFLYLAVVARSALLERRMSLHVQLFLLLAALLFVNTLQWNFNHGTSGPSRYVIWMMPIVFFTVAAEARGRAGLAVAALAVAVQAGVVASRGGLVPRYDYLQHSPAASFVLDHWPWLYNPDYEVFIKRTLHAEGRPTRGPYAYAVDRRCRKVLANRTHEAQVREICGEIPEGAAAFFQEEARSRGPERAWTYIDY